MSRSRLAGCFLTALSAGTLALPGCGEDEASGDGGSLALRASSAAAAGKGNSGGKAGSSGKGNSGGKAGSSGKGNSGGKGGSAGATGGSAGVGGASAGSGGTSGQGGAGMAGAPAGGSAGAGGGAGASSCPAGPPLGDRAAPAPGPSCAGGLMCGATSCCAVGKLPGGSFAMGRSDAGSDAFTWGAPQEQPEHTVTVPVGYLDTYETTVGRFRKFVDAYAAGYRPEPDAGAIAGIPDTGWRAEWDASLPAGKAALEAYVSCDATFENWTTSASTNEALPMNCLDYYLAFAFCAWDGGRLPTEAEWEYAAAGGDENRLYPWGAEPPGDPGKLPVRAAYVCYGDGGYNCYGGRNEMQPVGSYLNGIGRYGQLDLAGNVWEWTLDSYDAAYYESAAATCPAPTNRGASPSIAIRGGGFQQDDVNIRSARRAYADAQESGASRLAYGVRCIR